MQLDFDIVTLHRAKNYGAALQAYALRSFLEEAGYNAGIYDAEQILAPLKKSARTAAIQSLLRVGKALHAGAFRRKTEKFDAFAKEHFKLNLDENAKVYLAGSDQVWNPIVYNPAYYLEFVKAPSIKASYAASLGVTELPEDSFDRYRTALSDFYALSVREQSAQVQLERVFDGKKSVRVDLDPVFLPDKSRWEALAASSDISVKGEYILLYILHIPSNLNELCKWLKKETGLKTVLIDTTGYLSKKVDCDVSLIDVGPEDFLRLFTDASVVVTTSFHGTAFSVIFQKEFYSIIDSSFSGRVAHIMDAFGLPAVSDTQHEFSRLSMDFARSEERIAEQRSGSAAYFKDLQAAYRGNET